LQQLWGAGERGASAPAHPPAPKRVPARNVSGGRGSVVRQAVLQLVSYPVIALEVSEEERAALQDSREPGIELLRELIDNLRALPAQSPAQVIERWSGKPGGDSLEKLLQREHIVADAVAAARELRSALRKLAAFAVRTRLQTLEEKSRSTRLENDELLEY